MNSNVMDKANQALRRSSIRLRSLNSGHGDLNMVISDLKDVRAACKKYTNAQKLAWDDMSKWAAREKNMALQETFHYLSELGDLWYEVQREFIGGIKRLQQYFELILESETHLDKSRAYLTACERTELKIRKDFDKLNNRTSGDHNFMEERKVLNERLAHATASISAAQLEVTNKTLENESIKVVKVKEGMSEFSEGFLDLAYKNTMIFTAQVKVVECIPDARNAQLEDLKFTGSEISRKAVAKAKDDIHCYKRQSERANAPPPPYSSNPSSPNSSYGHYSNFSSPLSSSFTEADGRYCEIPEHPLSTESYSSPRYDLPPRENYENLIGAVGGIEISPGGQNHEYRLAGSTSPAPPENVLSLQHVIIITLRVCRLKWTPTSKAKDIHELNDLSVVCEL
ncbi:hypothetical protein GE061_000162 [Apolygus lucorum]|uniref:Uncharacterized protein n=1 Tax=Apolygus lucorum TaxID=248454 RepID=A0A8S9Y3L2_APOLU|nr:hypothetical protein GE061_000162 [Apolygus lucorum]